MTDIWFPNSVITMFIGETSRQRWQSDLNCCDLEKLALNQVKRRTFVKAYAPYTGLTQVSVQCVYDSPTSQFIPEKPGRQVQV